MSSSLYTYHRSCIDLRCVSILVVVELVGISVIVIVASIINYFLKSFLYIYGLSANRS